MAKNELVETSPNAYKLMGVEEIDAPEGCRESGKGRWYRYVIERNNSTIVGQRHGTRQQVTAHADAYVDQLNERSVAGSTSLWAPRQKK